MSVHAAAYREDFTSFLAKAFAILHPGKFLDIEWFHEAVAHQLARCEQGAITRLILTMPPRSLKSVTISVAWTAWLLGQDPAVKIMCVSYAEDLAKRHAVDARRLMMSQFYRQLFPDTVLSKETDMSLETTRGGGRFATTVGGTVTGLGSDWIIIDDPSKAEDALSKPLLEKAITFFKSTLSTRLNNPVTGRIILTMQRLHEEDLAGFCIGLGGWTHLTLPAVAEEDSTVEIKTGRFHHRKSGDLLQPARQPQSVLDERRRMLGSAAFRAQFQQAPLPAEGNMIQRRWLREYQTPPDRSLGRIIQSIDTAQKNQPSKDYSVITTWLWLDDKHYLLDVFRERCDYPTLQDRCKRLYNQHRPERVLIEDAGSGIPLIQDIKFSRADIVVVPIVAKAPKDVRVGAASALFENGQVLFPKEAPWLDNCIKEVLGFPNVKFDDVIDSIAQYLNWVRSGYGSGFFEYDMMWD